MKENKIKIIINRPIDVVFEFTTNPKNTHLWIASVKEEIAEVYPPIIGTKYKNRGIESVWSYYQVLSFEKDNLFVLSDLEEDYHVKYTYKQTEKDVTELEYFEWSTTGELKNPFSKNHLLRLKAILEDVIQR